MKEEKITKGYKTYTEEMFEEEAQFIYKLKDILKESCLETRQNQFIVARALDAVKDHKWEDYHDERTFMSLGFLLYQVLIEYSKKCFIRARYPDFAKSYDYPYYTNPDDTPQEAHDRYYAYWDQVTHDKIKNVLQELLAHLENYKPVK